MQLTTDLAAPIVERAMAILQRNVNIMDAGGYIVGSGDPARVGTFHQGAAAVLRTGRRLEIFPEDLAQWGGVRAGVNLPLRLNGQIAGVVGITGPPDEVRPYGELLREMVQLMLVQVRTAELERATALAREACLRDLLTGTGELPERLVREARLMGLDGVTEYRVLLCEPPRVTEPGQYAWVEGMTSRAEAVARAVDVEPLIVTGPWEGRLILVAGDPTGVLAGPLYKALGPGAVVAAGLGQRGLQGLRRSYNTALLALTAGGQLHGPGAFTAEMMMLETMLATVAPEEAAAFLKATAGELPPPGTRQGAQARETLEAFVRSGMSLSTAAEALGIHRHTLTYRLDNLAQETGLDPRTWDGAVRLYLGLMLERLFGQSVQES